MLEQTTRCRYAPSPTGLQHIGGVRTALFNYLFARSTDGQFILRLEDTDQTRCDPKYVENLYDTFAWLGFHWDEGPDLGGWAAPYIQSERTELYQNYAKELLAQGRAYYCFCTAERLEAVRKERTAAHASEQGYDRHCRDIDPVEAEKRAASGEKCVIRLKIPIGETTTFTDKLLGEITWKNDDVNPDPVLLKSDGFPTYHLANVVDDHLMGITHVLRAQEWLASTPLHVILYKAFGWDPPVFCHLPMVMGQDGKKLSKRHGSVSVDEFRRQGILPEALLNYVAQLGCSYGDAEIYTLADLERLFSIDNLNAAPAVFDYKKLEWFNGQYIRAMSNADLAAAALPFAVDAGLFRKDDGLSGMSIAMGLGADTQPNNTQLARFTAAMPLVRERAVYLTDIPDKIRFLFARPPVPALKEFFPKKCGITETVDYLERCAGFAVKLCGMDDAACEAFIKEYCGKEGLKMGNLLMPLRVAVTGSRVSPPLFGSMRILGPDECATRMNEALAALQKGEPV
jgi:glutamyl-tRNA synthetase